MERSTIVQTCFTIVIKEIRNLFDSAGDRVLKIKEAGSNHTITFGKTSYTVLKHLQTAHKKTNVTPAVKTPSQEDKPNEPQPVSKRPLSPSPSGLEAKRKIPRFGTTPQDNPNVPVQNRSGH